MKDLIKDFLVCHKFYDLKHRRVSAFANFEIDNNNLKIYLVTCSKKDTFSRKEAIKRMNFYIQENHLSEYKATDSVIHPVIYLIPSTSETYKRDFMSFLYDNLFVKEELLINIEETNRAIVSDLYGNLKTKETHVGNPRIKIISENEMEKYKECMEHSSKREDEFNAYLEMVSKTNNIENNQSN